MSAVAAPVTPVEDRHSRLISLVELGVLAAVVLVSIVTAVLVSSALRSGAPLTSPLVAVLLVANLVPDIALLVLIGRRVAIKRARRTALGGRARLQVRLVALFSVMAAVPMLLVASAASLLFQYGIEFSSSDRARAMVENSTALVRANYGREANSVARAARTMSGDLAGYLRRIPIDSPDFTRGLLLQTYQRELSEAMIVRRGEPDPLIVLNPYNRPLENIVTPAMMTALDRGAPVVSLPGRDRLGIVVPLAYRDHTYLYVSRILDEQLAQQFDRSEAILADYRALQDRSRVLQLRFNVALLVVSLLIVGIAVWVAFRVAERTIAPIAELVEAAGRVEAGDLAARTYEPHGDDEIATLARAFNRMTNRIEAQTGALDARRALIEAVVSNVSAGVLSIAPDGTVRLINRSAGLLLRAPADAVGRSLVAIAPELAALIEGGEREAIAQVATGGEERTLAVRIARDGDGTVLTFDDITEQLSDQRRAAWSDVARRIAHEIKNPLTPIQLAAERLQRRYGRQIANDDGTFQRLTETIVRQVGDLRRMVDEFSSFARMPKPVFEREDLGDIARQALFLHEVAHPAIRFTLSGDDPTLICDRRQIGQALTNLVKNAVEAIEARGGEGGEVAMTLTDAPGQTIVTIADDGTGLPAQRERIAEPYVTTRARGSGLGLAIVSKIVEEHCGTIAFSDRSGGGTVVVMTFDRTRLADLAPDESGVPLLEPLEQRT